jgi:dUTP pyrophosphatase
MSNNQETYRVKMLRVMDPKDSYSMKDFEAECKVETDNMMKKHASLFKFDVDFINKSDNQIPQYETGGSAGFDLRSNTNVTLKPFERAIIPTGLFFKFPPTLEMQIRPRSGLAAKYGVTVLNTPGTIDSDYRGEVKVILINLGDSDFIVENGDRIAQAIMANSTAGDLINLNEVSEILDNTERSSGGFGSTGIK